ncbi:MAG: hypothetical protein JGK03_02265 [Microcoleus sp. PH2017_25_DOB_D_A]|nr:MULTISPECIES: hypothetical protein [unclassified Microcoleus]MCC3410396.1 hypothetical protein [Microcoleus sp. PH2017_02_FOX_O_A]MCC3446028.1 hypothetical protein [Microcoleus sp. PH2017_09_SFU_O_A]MCC3470666.1 hypothetical protein [Microcoleus sp. PH2017_13_LAR_U_A]MCC3533040.1 hypothetical protein [Microcoleus sp. PH2017_25_DOB_D_A]MCC3570493.1 hypothetical protein [Microcoleus sp. PH2017_34_RAT_O_A]
MAARLWFEKASGGGGGDRTFDSLTPQFTGNLIRGRHKRAIVSLLNSV